MTSIFQFIITIVFAGIISSVGACTSTPDDKGDQTVSSAKNVNVTLISKDSGETLSEFSDSANTSAILAALESRERRYEKLMPFFEYKLNVSQNGEEQVWYVNKAGYVRKWDSSDLYKMDVSAVFK